MLNVMHKRRLFLLVLLFSALAAVFWLYLQPGFALDLANRLFLCA